MLAPGSSCDCVGEQHANVQEKNEALHLMFAV